MNKDDERLAESKRILQQVERESDHRAFRGINDLEDRLSPKKVDANDRIEVWGTRIGRGLGLLIALFLLLAIILWFGAARP